MKTDTQQQTKHTPGPWTVDGSYIHGPSGKRFLAVAGDGEGKANARLIAAATDLLAVARMAVEWAEKAPAPYRDWPHVVAARAAIARAEGRA